MRTHLFAPGSWAAVGQVEVALVTLLNSLQGHLDGAETFTRLLFIDFPWLLIVYSHII